MLDAANIAYGALPIRLHVIQDGKVVYEGGPGPMGYDMKDVRRWLEKNLIRCEGKSEWHERPMLKTCGLQWSHKVFANAKPPSAPSQDHHQWQQIVVVWVPKWFFF